MLTFSQADRDRDTGRYTLRLSCEAGTFECSAFVNVLFDKHDSKEHPDYANLIDLLTDMLHDAFDLSAEQRRVAYDHFLKRTMRLTHLYTMFEESHEQDVRARAKQPMPLLPTGGATAPYPATRGRSPSVKECPLPEPAPARITSSAPRGRNKLEQIHKQVTQIHIIKKNQKNQKMRKWKKIKQHG